MNHPLLFRNNELINQILKSSNEPIAVVDRNLKFIFCNHNFVSLIPDFNPERSIKDTFMISPSITGITQNYFSDSLNLIIKLIPLILDQQLEGFTVKIEKSNDSDYSGEKKILFRAAAHDLNNILTNILNSIDLLKNTPDDTISHNKLLSILENSSNRAVDIISSVLSKSTENKSFKNKIEINSLLEEIANSFRLFLPNRIKFETNIQFGLPEVLGNYTELYRCIYNLLINSKEAIKGTGSISLTAVQYLPVNDEEYSEVQKMISIKIIDTGIGINDENINKIFDKNFSTKNSEKISGIGLNNVKTIVENHKGKIRVSSMPGQETLFEILLPIIEKKGALVEEFKRIIIAEDEDTLRELLKDLFEAHKFFVTAVSDGLDVISTLKNDPYYDLIIIDKKMPQMDGLECISEIKKLQFDIPIILATGSTSEDLIKLEKEQNITHAIKKPYKFDELLGLANRIL